MTNVWLQRTNHGEFFSLGEIGKRLFQGQKLDLVTEPAAKTVRFYVIDRLRINARFLIHLSLQSGLGSGFWRD